MDAEPESVKRLYGIGDPRCDHFARQCLTARRLAERGVRFIQIYSGGMENQLSWDGHIDIKGNHESSPPRPTGRSPACWRTSRSADCWMRRWSSGAASSAACPSPRPARSPAATTTRTGLRCGWPAAGSRAA